jgi:nucleoside 2-deoxyribosyltransferase
MSAPITPEIAESLDIDEATDDDWTERHAPDAAMGWRELPESDEPEPASGAAAMKVYLAARFSRIDEMRECCAQLEARGFTVTSRWLNGGHEWEGTPDEAIPPDHAARFAIEDLDDIEAADILMCFTEPSRSGPSRGGRHVEAGYAIAKHKTVICVGHRENVFYCLPQIRFCTEFGEALSRLEAMRTNANPGAQEPTPDPWAEAAVSPLPLLRGRGGL